MSIKHLYLGSEGPYIFDDEEPYPGDTVLQGAIRVLDPTTGALPDTILKATSDGVYVGDSFVYPDTIGALTGTGDETTELQALIDEAATKNQMVDLGGVMVQVSRVDGIKCIRITDGCRGIKNGTIKCIDTVTNDPVDTVLYAHTNSTPFTISCDVDANHRSLYAHFYFHTDNIHIAGKSLNCGIWMQHNVEVVNSGVSVEINGQFNSHYTGANAQSVDVGGVKHVIDAAASYSGATGRTTIPLSSTSGILVNETLSSGTAFTCAGVRFQGCQKWLITGDIDCQPDTPFHTFVSFPCIYPFTDTGVKSSYGLHLGARAYGGTHGIHFAGPEHCKSVGCTYELNTHRGVHFADGDYCEVEDAKIIDFGGAAVTCGGSSGSLARGNKIKNIEAYTSQLIDGNDNVIFQMYVNCQDCVYENCYGEITGGVAAHAGILCSVDVNNNTFRNIVIKNVKVLIVHESDWGIPHVSNPTYGRDWYRSTTLSSTATGDSVGNTFQNIKGIDIDDCGLAILQDDAFRLDDVILENISFAGTFTRGLVVYNDSTTERLTIRSMKSVTWDNSAVSTVQFLTGSSPSVDNSRLRARIIEMRNVTVLDDDVIRTFTASDDSPSVLAGGIHECAAGIVSIDTFDDARNGDFITVRLHPDVTINHSTTTGRIRTFDEANITGDQNDLAFFQKLSGTWFQVGMVPSQQPASNNGFTDFTDGTNTATADAVGDTMKVRSANNRLTIVVTNDDATHGDNILFTLNEGNIDHNALANYLADQHVAHSSIEIIGSTGITVTNGTIDSNVTVALDTASALTVGTVGLWTFNNGVKVPDNQKLIAGAGNDVTLWHSGSGSFIDNVTGTFSIRQQVHAGTILLSVEDSGGVKRDVVTIDTTEGLRVTYQNLYITSPGVLKIGGNQVLNSRKGGWQSPTGTADRLAFDTATVTLSELAERVKALIDDLRDHHRMLGA